MLILLALSALGLSACSGGDGGSTGPGPGGSFTLSLATGTIPINQGSAADVTVNVVRGGGFAGAVNITVQGLPAGVSAAALSIPGGSASGTLTLTAAANATAGSATITVRGTATGVDAASATAFLTVNATPTPNPAFTLSASPAAVSVEQGASGQTTIGITRSGGFTGTVNLAAAGLPTGVTASLNPAAAGAATAILTLQVAAGAAPGTYNVSVQGTAPGVQPASAAVALTVTAAPPVTPGNVTWTSCGSTGVPVWVAYQDGNGPWTRATSAGTSANFQIDQPRGGVAWVVEYFVTFSGADVSVMYASREELIAWGTERCKEGADPGKTVTATVSGVNFPSQYAMASLGWIPSEDVIGRDAGPVTVTLRGVPSGPVDLFAHRGTEVTPQRSEYSTDRIILRRNLNPPGGGALAAIDFGSSEAFSPGSAALTVTGAEGAEDFRAETLLRTANGFGLVAQVDGLPGTWKTLPADRLQAGDLFMVSVLARSFTPLAPYRRAANMTAAATPQTVAFGPLLTQPQAQWLGGATSARGRVQYTVQSQYDRYWMAGFSQGARYAQVGITRAYHGSGAGSTVVLEMPDLTGLPGWKTSWEVLPLGLTSLWTSWSLTGVGWTSPGGITMPPWASGNSYVSATRQGLFTP